MQHLEKQLEKKQKELQEFEKKYKIRTKVKCPSSGKCSHFLCKRCYQYLALLQGPESNDAPTSLPAPEGAQGVLVS